jgi:hypothetical protein
VCSAGGRPYFAVRPGVDAVVTLQEYAKKVILRRNRLNGRLYKDDDTIMAWGMLNEPRCETFKVTARSCVARSQPAIVCWLSAVLSPDVCIVFG